jgi:hypothetical protein
MVTSPKEVGPDKDYAGEGQHHIWKTDPPSRKRGRPQKMGLDAKTYWLTDWLTDCKSQCEPGRALRRQLEEYEVGVRRPPVCEDVSPEAEERLLLEDITKQSSADRDWEHYSLCDTDI